MNKLYLFLVEGTTDEQSIALTLSRKLKNVKFHVIQTDITSDKDSSDENIEALIFERISFFLAEKPQFNYQDIEYVIQITDTDGTFINEKDIIEDISCKEFTYSGSCIRYKDKEKVVERNERKSGILKYLSSKSKIQHEVDNKPIILNYRLYFMSCNLEHVLHNNMNATKSQKDELAEKFFMDSGNNPNLLRDILANPSVVCSTNHQESWDYIQKGKNSLKRKSNFEFFFQEFVDKN